MKGVPTKYLSLIRVCACAHGSRFCVHATYCSYGSYDQSEEKQTCQCWDWVRPPPPPLVRTDSHDYFFFLQTASLTGHTLNIPRKFMLILTIILAITFTDYR